MYVFDKVENIFISINSAKCVIFFSLNGPRQRQNALIFLIQKLQDFIQICINFLGYTHHSFYTESADKP